MVRQGWDSSEHHIYGHYYQYPIQYNATLGVEIDFLVLIIRLAEAVFTNTLNIFTL